ncbi:hypothetical protein C5S31_06420 [ANME-1 cluster archaeon GoMg2]|nr:hypothetical protein [ANME-1 cluster archaeon GoMg2]
MLVRAEHAFTLKNKAKRVDENRLEKVYTREVNCTDIIIIAIQKYVDITKGRNTCNTETLLAVEPRAQHKPAIK